MENKAKDKDLKKQSKPTKKIKKTDKDIIKELKDQIKNQKNEYLSSLANLENDRKRFEKSKNEFIKFSNQKILEELITILDTFNLAMNIKNPSAEVKNFLTGFKMIANQFTTLLKDNGVTVIETKPGDKFDADIHLSVEKVKTNKFKSGQITLVVKPGYKIHQRLFRPTMVKIAK